MDFYRLDIPGLIVVVPDCYKDARGWFMETYSKPKYEALGITCEFVQDNASFTEKTGVIRGLHFQTQPFAQNKLVRCAKGKILDVAVDLRRGSPTYKKWAAVELSSDNNRQLYIPAGFAHGFVTLCPGVVVQYKVDKPYSPAHDRSVRYDDPEFGIDWGITDPILSDKDKNAPPLSGCGADFIYG